MKFRIYIVYITVELRPSCPVRVSVIDQKKCDRKIWCMGMRIIEKSPRNKTLIVNEAEKAELESRLLTDTKEQLKNKVICGDSLHILKNVPDNFVDLLIADPPYNLNKVYSNSSFKKMNEREYRDWLESWIGLIPRILKSEASVYLCCDWSCSSVMYDVGSKYFRVINRITWEREKGRGARKNWKNCSEDIWYFSNGDNPKFNLDAVKLKRKVVAPYRSNGVPKDWQKTDAGNFRLTAPSNLWTDITVPFWSMPENTQHPTQKPEKLIAKLILASSDKGDMICDPFLGSGTTAVVAKKLGRHFLGIEAEKEYCLVAQKRIDMALENNRIQGYEDGIFLERNTMQLQSSQSKIKNVQSFEETLL